MLDVSPVVGLLKTQGLFPGQGQARQDIQAEVDTFFKKNYCLQRKVGCRKTVINYHWVDLILDNDPENSCPCPGCPLNIVIEDLLPIRVCKILCTSVVEVVVRSHRVCWWSVCVQLPAIQQLFVTTVCLDRWLSQSVRDSPGQADEINQNNLLKLLAP